MSTFIRLRGLPWSVTHQEILDFLQNVKVVNGSKGIHMVTSRWDGKNTGEAFVELESEKDEEEAFKQNRATLGHRYIEIFSASNEEVQHAMKKPGSATSNVLKLRGLPYAVTEEQIEEFFQGLEIKPDREGILIVMDRRGRATGEAYVQFETQDDTEQALGRNREKIGHRYIEIFRSSIAEMRRQLSGNRPGPYDLKDRGSTRNRDDFGSGRNTLRGGDSRLTNMWNQTAIGFCKGGNNQLIYNPGNSPHIGGGFGGGNGNGFVSSNAGANFGNGNCGGFDLLNSISGFGGSAVAFGSGNTGFFNTNNNNNNDLNDGTGLATNSGQSFNGSNEGIRSSGNSAYVNSFEDLSNFGNRNNAFNASTNFDRNNFGVNSLMNSNSFNMSNMGGNGGNSNNGGNGFGSNDKARIKSSIGFSHNGGDSDTDYFCVHMRGLPYNSFENDVFKFFDPIRPANVKINFNNKGLHSGTADAIFETYEDAQLAMKLHMEQIGNRYIELFFDGRAKLNNNGFSRRI